MTDATIRELSRHVGETVRLRGWVENKRSSGKIAFLQIRDGSGVVQAVVSRAEVDDASWEAVAAASQEPVSG